MRGGGVICWNCRGGGFHRKKCSIKYEDVITFENILKAWEDFIRGKRKRLDINLFAQHLSDNLFDISYELKECRYKHGAYYEYTICDPKKRVIHKANVRDRVVHRLIYNALYPYFDSRFIYDSYSCRIGKGTHRAQARFRNFVNTVSKNYTRSCFVLKFDIKKCFENINATILKAILSQHIVDIKLRNITFDIIDSFETGLPLGNLTSQLFVNIYLHELDWHAKQIYKRIYYLRYADDVIVVSSNKEELEKLYSHLELFLKRELHLTSHKKVISSVYSGIDILGLVYFHKYTQLRRSTKRRAEKRKDETE